MIVLKEFRDRRNGRIMQPGADFDGSSNDAYVQCLMRQGRVGERRQREVPADAATFRDDVSPVVEPDGSDTGDRPELAPKRRRPAKKPSTRNRGK